MKGISGKMLVLVIVAFIAMLLLTGCNNFDSGDTIVATHDLSLYDYDSNVSKMHPWVCNLTAGQKVVFEATINDAGTAVVLVKDPNDFRCQGGSAQSNFKPLQ